VGKYDTPKYRHVAKERRDIKAMDAAWVEAVTDLWRKDAEIDFSTLENEFQLRPLETSGRTMTEDGHAHDRNRLLVCLTGFDDG
jgi:hypothetical protein